MEQCSQTWFWLVTYRKIHIMFQSHLLENNMKKGVRLQVFVLDGSSVRSPPESSLQPALHWWCQLPLSEYVPCARCAPNALFSFSNPSSHSDPYYPHFIGKGTKKLMTGPWLYLASKQQDQIWIQFYPRAPLGRHRALMALSPGFLGWAIPPFQLVDSP